MSDFKNSYVQFLSDNSLHGNGTLEVPLEDAEVLAIAVPSGTGDVSDQGSLVGSNFFIPELNVTICQ